MCKVYCGNIGIEYYYIQDCEKCCWICIKMESVELDMSYGFGND